jgi:uncharacterized membrane protein
MNKRQAVLAAALASVCATSAAAAEPSSESNADQEKCYGVSKAGQNDCATSVHGCASRAQADNDRAEWKYVAKGTCEKVGGKLTEGTKK